jgi:hypothetical protein
MEVGERLASGASLHDLSHGHLLTIGLGVQIAVAVVGAGVLRLTDRAADAAGVLVDTSRAPVPRPVAAVAFVSWFVPGRGTTRAASSRAPPSLP